MGTAAELFRHHAFVDLETTGLDPSIDRVIEVGALFVDEGKVVRRISKLFESPFPLPLSIRRLTGIDDADLAGQPAFEAFVPELRAALSGWTVVAHNASFEQSFLAELLEQIDAPVLDSCELLHYLYPELESYSLESMIRWTGIGDRATHRALKDCEDTFAMLCRAVDRCIQAGRADDVEEVLQCLAPGGPEALAQVPARSGLPMVELLSRLANDCRFPDRDPALGDSNRAFDGCSKEQAPSSGPSLFRGEAHHGAGVSERAQTEAAGPAPEAQMAQWLQAALASEGTSAVEPGRAASQKLAYLAPAAAFARKNACRVTIAVGSESRLARLLSTELPRVQRDTAEGLHYSFLAEQQQYLCRRRAADVSKTDARMSYEERAPRAYLKAFLRCSPTGELSKLSYWFKGRYPLLQRLAFAARSEPATTLAERCPLYAQCFYHSAVKRSKEADLLLLQQPVLAEWPPDYPTSRHLLIDEAHQLEGAMATALSRELSNAALARLSDRMLGVEGRGGLLAALGSQMRGIVEPWAAALRSGDGALRVRVISLDGERLGSALATLCPEENTPYRRELLLNAEIEASIDWAPVRAMLVELKMHLAELGDWLSALRDELPQLSRVNPGLERDVLGASCEVQALLKTTAEFAGPARDARILFASVEASSIGWRLRSEPLDVSDAFGRLAKDRSVVLSSTALSVGGDKPWLLERLGVARAPHWTSKESSTRPLVLLIADAPRPFDEEFLDWAASRICGIAAFLGGKVMGLFASQLRLVQIEERVRANLERSGIETVRIFQSRRDGARPVDPTAGRVVLGSRSLWHRSHASHDVACVFIDKLPIDPISKPAIAAREALAARDGADARYGMMPYRLPRALVLLRHWLSTCTTSSDEKRVIVIAHPGAAQHRDALIDALEGYRPEVVPWSLARVKIYETLRPIAARLDGSRPLSRAASP
ncbi:MAG TPA: exonuclease domain-containing protein [Myxococcaceae bacterium]|nr:exonuclease domain-containing protein [Myxococcaceae bacterium]